MTEPIKKDVELWDAVQFRVDGRWIVGRAHIPCIYRGQRRQNRKSKNRIELASHKKHSRKKRRSSFQQSVSAESFDDSVMKGDLGYHTFNMHGGPSASDISLRRRRWMLPSRWWTFLNPQYILAIMWYIGTLPLCFLDTQKLMVPLLARVIGLPVLVFIRPLFISCPLPYPTSFWKNKAWFVLFWVLRILVLGLPIGVYVMGYSETGTFISVIHNLTPANQCFHDGVIKNIDQNMFGYQPALMWKDAESTTAHLMGMEYLQFAYSMLYINVTLIPFLLWFLRKEKVDESGRGRRGRASDALLSSSSISIRMRAEDSLDPSVDPRELIRDDHEAYDQALSTLLVSSFMCWAFYMVYPVTGPLWCFDFPPAQDVGYFFAWLNLDLQKAGAAHGTATPSSHCASSLGLWIIVLMHNKKLAAVMTLWNPALIFATVYCQYHYAFDAIVGTAIGLVVPLLGVLADRSIRWSFGLRQGPFSHWLDEDRPPRWSNGSIKTARSPEPEPDRWREGVDCHKKRYSY